MNSFIVSSSFAQIVHVNGDFRTIASGDFNDVNIWEIWNGSTWTPASVKPDRNNSIFIDQNHEVRLIQNEETNHVYLYSAASPGNKLNLQAFELQVYGALRGLQKIAGIFHTNSVTNASTDWIYPQTGKIVFKGTSRVVVDRSTWSANTANSRYTVVFDPDIGENLVVNSAFKASKFIILSGTVTQTVNTAGVAACSTFSFNNNIAFNGSGPYGDFEIEPGATLVSECSAPLESIIRRSATVPAASFRIKPNGNLVLLGSEPIIDAAQFELDGNVYFSSHTGSQRMIRSSMPSSGNSNTYNNIFFENGSTKILLDSLYLNGDFSAISGVAIQEGPTYLCFQGTGDQQIINWTLDLHQVEVNKSSGRILTNTDFITKSDFKMRSGQVDFGGNDLFINIEGSGSYTYEGGRWNNLNAIHFNHAAGILTEENATFPIEDVFQGGNRTIQILGNSPGGNLTVKHNQFPGANWDPAYDDLDGTPILYQLNSYYEFSGLNPSSDLVELRISAENLIVDNLDDLRLVSNGQAAPGSHLPAADPAKLWARRNLEYGELNNESFTIGSYRILSILPVTWLNVEAERKSIGNIITWSTANEQLNERFIIHRAIDNINGFLPIGEIKSKGESREVQVYEFIDPFYSNSKNVYYQLEQIDQNLISSFSKVVRLKVEERMNIGEEISIWPNPFSSTDLNIVLPQRFDKENTRFQIFDPQGNLYHESLYDIERIREIAGKLKPGLFYISIRDKNNHKTLRVVKK